MAQELRLIKLNVPVDQLDQLNDACNRQQRNRSDMLREVIDQYLNTVMPVFDRTKFLAASTAVLRATNGKLSRQEADHLVALVVKEMHHGE